MKEKKDCKIVQDLLPNYIEKLTNEETNNYVKEHVKECSECREMLENMQKNLSIASKENSKKEVKYMKKFANKMKLLRLIILLMIVLFVILTARKMVIISNLSNRAEKVINNTNYHRITYSYSPGKYSKLEVFSLADKKKIITTTVTDEETKTRIMYAKKADITNQESDQYITNIYIETKDGKSTYQNKEMHIQSDLQNTMKTENGGQLLMCSLLASVKTARFDGNECYYITNFNSPNTYSSKGMYINKETGLPISTIAYEYENSDGTRGRWPSAEYIYEANTVTESDFIEPNIEEYEIR